MSRRPPQRPPPRSASRRKRERRRVAATLGPARNRTWWQRRSVLNGVAAGVVVIVVVVLIVALRSTSGSSSPTSAATTPKPSPTSTPLASLSSAITGQTIDGIQCQANEQLVYHIHAHLAIYVNGVARSIPEGIGIPPPRREVPTDEGPYVESGKCFYWIHTHTDDGIIHIESPTTTAYALTQFFALWSQPLTASQVGPARGLVIAYVNGQRYTGDVQQLTLTAHELIQLDVGTDVPPKSFSFPPGL